MEGEARTGYHTPASAQHPRPLQLRYGALEQSLLIPSAYYLVASQLRDAALVKLPPPAPETEAPVDGQPCSEAELTAIFLRHVSQTVIEEPGSHDELLAAVLTEFERAFLKGNDVHAVAATLSGDSANRNLVIKSYYGARLASGKSIKGYDSALVRAVQDGDASVFAIFGGQGNIEEYFDELRELVDVYDGLVTDIVEQAAELLNSLLASPEAQANYGKGLDILAWLHDRSKTPDIDYLVSAPVSFPLIGLTQLAHYIAAARILGRTPGQMRDVFRGATGHSQGIVTAVCIAVSESWEDYFQNARSCIELLFWIGCRSQQVYPSTSLPPAALQDSLGAGEGTPTPMLSVRDLDRPSLQKQIDITNTHLPEERKIGIALVNGPRNFVVSGPPQSLYGLNLGLRRIKADSSENYGRVPFSQRKVKFVNRFLPISAPFHSPYLAPAVPIVLNDCRSVRFTSELAIPVFATDDGSNLQDCPADRLVQRLVEMIEQLPVQWVEATKFVEATHVIDFGPGGASGLGGLTHRNKDGTGIRVILAGSFEVAGQEMGCKVEMFDREASSVKYAVNWLQRYSPRLCRTASGKVYVDTPFSRLLGKAPIMVGGMTPCTVPWDFVAATMNAGYHIELAGGGYYSPAAMTEAVRKIQRNTIPGSGITPNIIYINPRTYAWQAPLVKSLREQGFAIDGCTIAAGIPSLEVANDLCQTLGVKHISFKPGSADAIQQVIAIAKANPSFPIILQWTGGRAGGHHSFEDFHSPILSTYSAIRRCSNIILVAGSGFGGADDTIPYLTGEWSLRFSAPHMPFDGVLLASRVMTALEAKTSLGAKQAIVDAPGLEDKDWEKTYAGAAGGVITVRSELGEPIHKLATRGVLLWREMDDTIFNLAKEKRTAALKAKKEYIIKRLNADFQKVWFARDSQGSPCDLEDMTYAEVAARMVELMYVKHERRWIDKSHRNLVGDFVRRIEERFTRETGVASLLQSYSQLENPSAPLSEILDRYPDARKQLMSVQDVEHFLILCQRRGQKPVPFIPVLDDQFEVWFKKDSLWQSEDLEAVVGQDVGRVAILQGPMAARHSTKVNQPIREILDDIHEGHIKLLLERAYGGDLKNVPQVEYFGGSEPADVSAFGPMNPSGKAVFNFPAASAGGALPDTDLWLQFLAGKNFSWRRALLTTDVVVQGTAMLRNPMRRLFSPRYSTQFVIDESEGLSKSSITIFDRRAGAYVPAVRASFDGQDGIEVLLYEDRTADKKLISLPLRFTYHPETGFAPIRELHADRNDRIKQFYWRLWFGEDLPTDLDASDLDKMTFTGDQVTISGKAIEDFCHVVGNDSEAYVRRGDHKRQAPMDFAIVVGWKAVIKAIFPKRIDGDLLRLVHLSNGFRLVPGADPLCEGDEVESSAQINAVINSASGKTVEVEGTITREGKPVIQVLSRFLYRGSFDDFDRTFRRTHETPVQLLIESAKDVEVLRSKDWFQPISEDQQLIGATLTFRLSSLVRYKTPEIFSEVSTSGPVLLELPTKEIIQVASVQYEAGESFGNPVIDYLTRNGRSIEQPFKFDNGGYSVIQMAEDVYSSTSITPPSNSPYAEISGDFNPIHVSPSFSSYVELPGLSGITHGMYTSASTRKFVETFAAENVPTRVMSYDVTFLDMVLPNTKLQTKLAHVGMVNGKKMIKVETFNVESGAKVLEGTAEVEQPITAYVFTGQGSQEQGMGMELYSSSPVAREVWDRADRHFLENYGFSILNIVKNNPKELTIHFGGPRGQRIKQNYTSMVYEVVDDEGNNVTRPIFKDITADSTFYKFISPTGLLSATQFTQPSLTLMEKAAFEDMKSKGLIQQNASFGGHSLGEYSALAAIANVIPIESLVDVVFYRGMTMQVAVPRDAGGRSDYAMMAVNPSRVGKTFNEAALRYVVENVAAQTGWLAEIVNYNVENQQYIAAGSLGALDALSNVLNVIKTQKIELDKLMATMSMEDVKAKLAEIIDMCKAKSLEKAQAGGGRVELERGFATIPLKGIDVPFHSSFLRNGVKPFRSFLAKKITKSQINPNLLIGNYIPNVTAKPFAITKEYVTECYELTKSPRLRAILENWQSLSTK